MSSIPVFILIISGYCFLHDADFSPLQEQGTHRIFRRELLYQKFNGILHTTTRTRVGHRIFGHINNISVPRFAGSAGETKAQKYLRTQLYGAGYDIHERQVQTSLFPFDVLPRLIVAGVLLLILSAVVVMQSIPILGVELAFISGLLLLGTSRWSHIREGTYSFLSFGTIKSRNIIALPPASDRYLNVVFTAHYDSKSQLLSRFWFTWLVHIFWGATWATVISFPLNLVFAWPFEALLLPAGIVFLIGLILVLNITRNTSPGAVDNASGVGVLLELALSYAQQVCPVNLGFVLLGAEEAEHSGTVSLMKDELFRERFPSSRTIIINLDSLGTDDPLYIMNRTGIPPMKKNRLLTQLIVEIGKRFGIDIKEGWQNVEASMSHVPMNLHGYEAVSLTSVNFGTSSRVIHTKADTSANIDISSLEVAYAVCQEVIDSLPALRQIITKN